MNVYGLHKKADPSMYTVQAKNCLQNTTAETLRKAFFKENQFWGVSNFPYCSI